MSHRSMSGVLRVVVSMVLAVFATAPASAQFAAPGITNVRERITGDVLSGTDGVVPAAGDEVGAFFNNTVVGKFSFTSTGTTAPSRNFSMIIYGDNPDTTTVEGPREGQAVTFRFYDASANTVIDNVRVETPQGERFNFTYQGQVIIPLPVPIDITPTRNFNLRVGGTDDDDGGDGGEGDGNKYDLDQNGDVDERDAAVVLRIVVGRGAPDADTASRADVNGDSVVSTADAIEIMRNQ